MKERQKLIVTGLTILLLILWLGFVVHRSPRFAGSPSGGVLGVSGALLMLVPFAYLVVKRIKRLKKVISKHVSMRTLLAWHIYAGTLGPILVLLHTGHKFESPLGIALTSMTLLVVISGFVGRYLMNQFSAEIREKKAMLSNLNAAYQRSAAHLATDPQSASALRPFSGLLGRVMASLFIRDVATEPLGSSTAEITTPATMLRLSESIADLEYAIKTHELFKRWFGKWLKIHIVISFVLYALMGLHVWSAIHFGLRWFEPSSTSHFARSRTVAGARLSQPSPPFGVSRENADSLDEFSQSFGRLFRRSWRPAIAIHGIQTTVFDYAGIAQEIGQPDSDFSRALMALQRVTPDSLMRGDRAKAFWINVYNFGAMKLAAENYPVPSIIDPKISADDPWSVDAVSIGNVSYSLKQIENAILLKNFDDPRIVFAISCAAVSCPDRTDEIFTEERIDEQLDAMIRGLFANRDKGLRIDRQRKVVTLSWIVKADQRLFGGNEEGVLRFVRQYVSDDIRDWIDLHLGEIVMEYFPHDWSLNDIALMDGLGLPPASDSRQAK